MTERRDSYDETGGERREFNIEQENDLPQLSSSPPAGSAIEVEESHEIVVLRWEPTETHPTRRLAFLLLGLFLFTAMMQVIVVVLIDPLAPLPQQQLQDDFWFGKWMAVFPAMLFLFLLFLWFRLSKAEIAEKLEITSDTFLFDSGDPPVPRWLHAFFNPFWPFLSLSNGESSFTTSLPRRTQVQCHWNEIEQFHLERVGERQRLTFDLGAKRIEIGRTLDEPEREWLAEELNRIHQTVIEA